MIINTWYAFQSKNYTIVSFLNHCGIWHCYNFQTSDQNLLDLEKIQTNVWVVSKIEKLNAAMYSILSAIIVDWNTELWKILQLIIT